MNAQARRRAVNIAFGFALALLCLYATIYTFGTSNLIKPYPNTSAVSMLSGESPRPFVYRTLLPQLTHLIVALTPDMLAEEIGNGVTALVQSESVTKLITLAKWKGFYTDNITGPQTVYAISIIFMLMWGALCAYGVALQRLSAHFFRDYEWLPYLTALFGVLLVVPFIKSVSKLYDFPVLALFALGLLFMYRRDWRWYLICFAAATCNKETSLLLAGFFALLYWQEMPRPQFKKLMMAQLVIYLTVMSATHLLFSDNRGSEYWHSFIAIVFLHFRDISAVHIMIWIIGFRLVTAHWREMPPELRKSVWLFVACGVLYYFFGRYREYRIFFECFPGLTVMAGYTLFRPLEKEISPLPLKRERGG